VYLVNFPPILDSIADFPFCLHLAVTSETNPGCYFNASAETLNQFLGACKKSWQPAETTVARQFNEGCGPSCRAADLCPRFKQIPEPIRIR
jgi:hypothetical protein